MKQTYILYIHKETLFSAVDLVQYFNQHDIRLSLERDLDKTQGHFPMHFTGKLFKSEKNAEWDSSFELYSNQDALEHHPDNDFSKAFTINTYNELDELSLAYLGAYFIENQGAVYHCDRHIYLSKDELVSSAEKQYLDDEATDKNEKTKLNSTLIDDYYSTAASSLELLADQVMKKIMQTQSSATPLSDLNVIVHSDDFNQVKDFDYFLEKLADFLDENQLDKNALSLLRSALYPSKKKLKYPASLISVVVIGLILSLFIFSTDETLSSLIGCLLAVFSLIPVYRGSKRIFSKLNDWLCLLFSSYFSFLFLLILAIISEILFAYSYTFYNLLISMTAMSLIQAVITTVVVVILFIVYLYN